MGDIVRNPLANIIVRNLNKSLNQSKVYEHFSQFGKISSCKLNVFEDGSSRGFAYIQYNEPEDAQKAIQALNKQVWEGNTLEIDLHKTRDQRSTIGDTQNFTNLYVQGFGASTTQKDLEAIFAKMGKLDSCQIKLNEQGQSTQTAFVSYVKSEDAQRAISELNKTTLNGGMMGVNRFIYKQENMLHKDGLTPIAQNMKKTFDNNIFVNFIPLDVTEE